MKKRVTQDEEIRGKIAIALTAAVKKRKNVEEAAQLLEVELGTLYKYMAGAMIPGGQVLWRACVRLGMVLDERGLRLSRTRKRGLLPSTSDTIQYKIPFIDESVDGQKVRLQVRRKDSQYVQVRLRIKVAG
jgi:hypothetical protein